MKRNSAAWTLVLTLALPMGAAASEPNLEAAKAASGLKFGEGMAATARVGGESAVYAGEAGPKSFSFESIREAAGRNPSLSATVPEPRARKAPQPPPSDKESIGRILLRTAGGAAGLAATIAIASAAPIALGMAAVAGATALAWKAIGEKKSAWQVVKQGFIGAVVGGLSLVMIGDAAGNSLGKGLERIFRR